MKKIFFELLKKWTNDDGHANNKNKPIYYLNGEDDPVYTLENLADPPPSKTKHK